jgi:hypothetical protein
MRLRTGIALPIEIPNDGADDEQLAPIFMSLAPKPFRKPLKAMLRKRRLN